MRRRPASKRRVAPDPRYHSVLITKAINQLMLDGKKVLAQKIFYETLASIETISQKSKKKEEPLIIFEQAINNLSPQLELKSRRIGGANYQIPIEVREERQTTLALRWLIQFAKKRSEHTMIERLTAEIMAAYKKTGSAFKHKENIHKMARANRAFANYR